MTRLVCGRCGQYAAPNSTYCPQDRWVLLADHAAAETPGGQPLGFDVPASHSGFVARKRQEGARDSLERTYRSNLERRLEVLEARLESEPENPQVQRAMGLMAMLEDQNERASALLERALALDNNDLETHVNLAIVLAKRGKLQPSLNLLEAARQKWPDAPLLLFNSALIALQARRPSLVHQCVDALEKLWLQNAELAQEFHDEAVTARGLAFLLEKKPREAMRELEAAARHVVHHQRGDEDSGHATDDLNDDDDTFLEGKTNEADALNNLALAEIEMGQVDRAVARLQAALRLEPGHPEVLNNLGVLAYRQGRLDVALKYLDLARQVEEYLEKPDPVTWNHLGVVLSSLGRLDEGLEHFQRAGSAEHAEFEVYYNLGRAFIEHGKPDLGVEYLRQSFTIEPNNPDVHVVLGAAYLLRGRAQFYPEAIKHFKRALQLNPHHRTAATDLTMTLIELRNFEAAQKLLAQELKIFPGDAEGHFLGGLLTLETPHLAGKEESFLAGAAQRFDTAFSARPDVAAALYNSALCQFIMGFHDTSAKLLDAATHYDASLGPAYYLIGFGHAVGKRDVEALKAWQTAMRFESNNPDLHANIAALLYRRGDFQGASKAYLTAHRLLPGDANILSALGVVFARLQMYNQAIAALDQSIQINPLSPMTHSNLGLAYYLFTRVEKAMEHWRMVSKLDSAYAASREEEQQRSFDDSVVQLRPLHWRDRIVKMAPVLPRPQTRLLPGTNVRTYRPALSDQTLVQVVSQKREVERVSRSLAGMNLKI